MLSIFYIVRVTRSSIQGHHPDSKVYGANIGPTWGRQDPGGPHVGPMNFAIWGKYCPTFDIVASYLPIGNVYEFVRSSGRRCCNFTKPVSVFMTQCISYKFVVFAFYLVILGCDIGKVVCIHILQDYFTGTHDDVIKWKHFPCYWTFVRGIHRSPVNSSYKGQLRGAFVFSLIYAWINSWVNNRGAGDLRPHRAHYDVTFML